MRRIFAISTVAITLILLTVTGLGAQSAGPAISRRVIDQDGAVIAGAVLRLWQQSLSFERMAKGDGSGEAQFKQLLRGRYQLSVTGEGVAALTREIDLAGDENAKLELVLEPVAIAEERAVNGLRIADTPETIERIPGSIAIIDEKTFETSRVFTFTEALRLTARGILPSSPRLAQGGLKFRF